MTIKMYCDRCGEMVGSDVNGGVRLRTGKRELAFHLCETHQGSLRALVMEFCEQSPPREVATSLKL